MLQTYSNGTIERCHFVSNEASDDGGAIYVSRRSILNVASSTFTANKARNSGGSILVQHSQVHIEKCQFHKESVSEAYGGSIAVQTVGDITVKETTFRQCEAPLGGSYALVAESVIKIENSVLSQSFSSSSGGGIMLDYKSVLTARNLTIKNGKSTKGGGIAIADSSEVSAEGIYMSENRASESGGGVYCEESSFVLNAGNIIHNDAEKNGGGIYLELCCGVFDDITFIGNTALLRGAAICGESSSIELFNSEIKVNNVSKTEGMTTASYHSQLWSKNLKLHFMGPYGNFSDIIQVMNHSEGEMHHTQIQMDNASIYCPITVTLESHLALTSLYLDYVNMTTVEDKVNVNGSSKEGVKSVCEDNTSQVSGIEAGQRLSIELRISGVHDSRLF